MSTSCVTLPMVGAVVGTEQFLGPNLRWNAANALQERFLGEFFALCRDSVNKLSFMETLASMSAAEINAFLKKKGFSITLEDFPAGGFGVASVLDLLVAWTVEGIKQSMAVDGREYAGVRIGEEGFTASRCYGHSHPVATIDTKTGYKVHLTVLDEQLEGFALVDKASGILKGLVRTGGYDALHFPMVDLNQEVDINWLVGLNTTVKGQNWAVAEAKQQTKLRMNEKGARAQSAVAIGMRCTSVRMPQPILEIDKPFLVIFTGDDLPTPIFTARVTQDDWKEPADLETA